MKISIWDALKLGFGFYIGAEVTHQLIYFIAAFLQKVLEA